MVRRSMTTVIRVTSDILAIMMVLEFPPRLSFRSQVSAESRYGTKFCFLFIPPPMDRSAVTTEITKNIH